MTTERERCLLTVVRELCASSQVARHENPAKVLQDMDDLLAILIMIETTAKHDACEGDDP